MTEHIFLIAAIRNLFVRGTVKWKEDFFDSLRQTFSRQKFEKPKRNNVLPTDYYKAKHNV